MNTGTALMLIYLVVTAIFQAISFGLSKLVDLYDPTWSLLAFLVLFLGAFWAAWPAAVVVTQRLIPMTEDERLAATAAFQATAPAVKI
jgi:hypothetical protein